MTSSMLKSMKNKTVFSNGKGKNSVSGKNAALKRGAINAAKAAYEGETFDVPVVLKITHYRRVKCDTDAPVVKWLIDCIVAAGVLRDDSTDEIKEIRQAFVKVKNEIDEKTVVEIEVCEG